MAKLVAPEPRDPPSPRDLADRLARAYRKPTLWLRLRGLEACRTDEERFSMHVSRASRWLRRRELDKAEAELRAALAALEQVPRGFDPAPLRSVLQEARRSLCGPEYEAALHRASTRSDPESILQELSQARRAAEEMGDPEAVQWVDQMMQGPKLGPGGASTAGASGSGVQTEEEKRRQIRRYSEEYQRYRERRERRVKRAGRSYQGGKGPRY